MMRNSRLVLFSLLALFVLAQESLFENTSVIKTVDLTEAIVSVSIRYQIKPMDENVVDYQVALMNSEIEHMSYIEVSSIKKIPVSIKKAQEQTQDGVTLFNVHFSDTIPEGTVFYVNYYLTHVLVSLPTVVPQDEIPRYVFTDSLYVQSPYVSLRQEIRYKFPSSNIVSFTDISPNKQDENTLIYGPFTSISPFTELVPIRVHFPTLSKFRTLDTVEREIEVSHWGNVAFEEVIHARNSGSPLTGEFSRLDYYRSDPDNIPAWEGLVARIDRRATDIYYRDKIGNITTSHVRKDNDRTLVQLQMRFPMMGGWKNEFYWGYNLPSARVLKKQGTRYSLTVPFSTPIEKVDVCELTVRVILPECVKNVKFVLPEGVEQVSESKRYTYLDSSLEGRHVYEFIQRNVIGLHSSETLTVSYDLSPWMLWREPLMCIGAFFGLFLVKAIIRVLTREEKEKEKRD